MLLKPAFIYILAQWRKVNIIVLIEFLESGFFAFVKSLVYSIDSLLQLLEL